MFAGKPKSVQDFLEAEFVGGLRAFLPSRVWFAAKRSAHPEWPRKFFNSTAERFQLLPFTVT